MSSKAFVLTYSSVTFCRGGARVAHLQPQGRATAGGRAGAAVRALRAALDAPPLGAAAARCASPTAPFLYHTNHSLHPTLPTFTGYIV